MTMTIGAMQRMLRASGYEIAESEILLAMLRAGKPVEQPAKPSTNTLDGLTCNTCDAFLVDGPCTLHP